MQFIHQRFFVVAVVASLMLAGCALPVVTPVPTPGAGAYAATVSVLQTRAVATATAQGFGAGLTPIPPTLPPGQVGGTSQSPVVTTDTQCMRGPGTEYEVIGTIARGTEVSLLGRGVVVGWFIVRHPAAGSPCWLQANVLRFPAGYDISALPIYDPPATATVTPMPTSATPGALPTSTP